MFELLTLPLCPSVDGLSVAFWLMSFGWFLGSGCLCPSREGLEAPLLGMVSSCFVSERDSFRALSFSVLQSTVQIPPCLLQHKVIRVSLRVQGKECGLCCVQLFFFVFLTSYVEHKDALDHSSFSFRLKGPIQEVPLLTGNTLSWLVPCVTVNIGTYFGEAGALFCSALTLFCLDTSHICFPSCDRHSFILLSGHWLSPPTHGCLLS